MFGWDLCNIIIVQVALSIHCLAFRIFDPMKLKKNTFHRTKKMKIGSQTFCGCGLDEESWGRNVFGNIPLIFFEKNIAQGEVIIIAGLGLI